MSQNRAYIVDNENAVADVKLTTSVSESRRERKGTSCKQICCMQLFVVVVFALGIVGGILIGIYAYHGDSKNNNIDVNCQTNSQEQGGSKLQTTKSPAKELPKEPGVCPNPNPVQDTRYENYVYAPLTSTEMNKVAKYLLQQSIISTLEDPTSLTQSFILYQALQPPNKAEALEYLDKGGDKPKRYAKVTVQRGHVPSPDVMEYKVGPLDGTTMTAVNMTFPGYIHFNSRPYEWLEVAAMTDLLRPDLDILAPLISESFDGARFPDDIYFNFFNGPPSTNGKERDTRWNIAFKGFRHEEDVDLIHILPLSGRVHNPGTDTSKWYTYDFHYLNQGPFNTSQELMAAYNSNTLRKVKLEPGFRNTLWDRIFPKRDSSLPLRDRADSQGTRAYYPTGPRYTIEGTHVKWMDWSFDISGSQMRGPALFNINFKNERIIYELAVNDIALNYAMDSHAQNNIIYADATYGIMGGDYPTTIMSGVDCPEHATVLNTTFWWHPTQSAYDMRSICIFEADGQDALWRHVGISFEAGLRNRHLIVRAPVVVGNYDYTFEFHFFLDGKVYTHAKASGYIQSSFWDEFNPNSPDKTRDAFGYRLSDYGTGPVHDHMFGFKVDMDIIDKNNTFQIVKWKAGPVLEALKTQNPNITKAPEYFIYNETRYIEWENVQKEIGIQDPSEQQFWLVVNEREKNKWGVERGYQIAPLATGDQALKTHPLLQALSFTKYHCAVTKRKEEEQTLTSIYDVNRMEHAQEYLDKHINGESIVDDDIVNWVTVGFLHVPTTEDMPMTVKVETGFMLRPFNFFDRTSSFDMPEHAETRDGILRESEPSFEQCSEPKTEYCRFC
ncbi:amiloride-sensitive amine oxidase [copper-containing]-like [Mercenaria mercenaria]|uniref:amiloride-sensitive amine oxidase [copper-containing]-like n=1 Tax=Mercenaria mercenaria TaxID=6596 RepID=UPI00234E7DC1|nr:amiloride-sensitive amine oxidase [copper-containing]-like [Mercenaria mercenaria]